MSDNFTDDLLREVKQITEKQREIAEKSGVQSAEYKRYMENADAKMAEFDKKNDELVAKMAEEAKAKEEMKERLAGLEANLALATSGGGAKQADGKGANRFVNAMLKNRWEDYTAKHEAEAKSLIESMKESIDFRNAEGAQKMASDFERKAASDLLRSDIGELGGFLCPPEYAAELEKNMIEYAPIRRYARVKRTASKVYKQPVRIGVPTASRPGEAREGGSSVSNYGLVDFTPVRLTNTTAVTVDELAFNAYDLAGELILDNAEAFGVKEGQEFFNGAGPGAEEGLGWSVDPNVPQFTTATTTLTFDDMINITGELKQGYNPMYMFNRRTLAYLRTLKDQNDRYLWNGPFGDAASGAGATINGLPYSAAFIEFDDFDTSGGFPVLFADMMKFYQIVDRTDVTIIRDEYTRKKEGIVEFTFNKWCYGAPMVKEAGIRMLRRA